MNAMRTESFVPPMMPYWSRACALPTRTMLPPPPPPPPPAKKTRRAVWVVAALLVVMLLVSSLLYFNVLPWPFKPKEGVKEVVNIVAGGFAEAADTSIGSQGGTLHVSDVLSPIRGLKIEFPEGAAGEGVHMTVSYANITSVKGIPENASVASKLIRIEPSGSLEWNKTKHFEAPVLVTLPYDSSLVSSDQVVRFYCYDSSNGALDSAGFLYETPSEHTVTFYTTSFSDFLGISLYIWYGIEALYGYSAETGFTPGRNGWFMPNHGSYLNPGGYCLGMSCYARWFYRYKSVEDWTMGAWTMTGTPLNDKYIEGDQAQWRDDATAIQLASRAQMAADQIFRQVDREGKYDSVSLGNSTRYDSRRVALTWLHGMIVTHEPQIVGLKTRFSGGAISTGGHAVLAYRYDNGRFDIYDPNFPETVPGTDARQIPFSWNTGFARSYTSSANPTASAQQYNVFLALGWKLLASQSLYEGLWEAAEKKFKDDNIFPEVKLTSEHTTPGGTTPEDTNADGIRDTRLSKVQISGTISGGQAGTVGDGVIFVSGQRIQVFVVGSHPDYSFSVEVPLFQGDNEIIFIASLDLYRYWAGYLKDTIRCNASKADLTITLTWNQDASDVDLHVLEPEIEGSPGRHIRYNERGGYAGGPYPYLDIDNTNGYGPEHYYANENMTLPNYEGEGAWLYGTYKVRAHYYADHDDDENRTQSIAWQLTVKLLAFRVQQTGQEFWIEKSTSGVLTTADTEDTSNFQNSDPSWSPVWEVEYPQPRPSDFSVPPPPQNQLPR